MGANKFVFVAFGVAVAATRGAVCVSVGVEGWFDARFGMEDAGERSTTGMLMEEGPLGVNVLAGRGDSLEL